MPDREVSAENGPGQIGLGRSAELAGRGMSHHILGTVGLIAGGRFVGIQWNIGSRDMKLPHHFESWFTTGRMKREVW